MLLCTVSLLFTILVILASYIGLPLYRNIQAAKSTGLLYKVVPFYHYNFITGRIFNYTILRNLDKILPKPAVTSWRVLVNANWPLKTRHAVFKAFKTDSFLLVAPGGIIFATADPSVNTQILSRDAQYPKAIDIYKSIRIYGENVVSSDGPSLKYHRKLTSHAFGEKNNRLVWHASLNGTQQMMESFRGPNGILETVENFAGAAQRLSLEVLGQAGLGEKLELSSLADTGLTASGGRTFAHSLDYVMKNVISIMAVKSLPPWVQNMRCGRYSFGKLLCIYEEWRQHMQGMIAAKRKAIESGAANAATIDLIGQLIKGQDLDMEGKPNLPKLSDSEVMGNLFAFIVAGHETSGNSIHFSLIHLALQPHVQQRVQKDLEKVFGGRPMSEWEYETYFAKLLNGYLGAVMSETLRLESPVLTIPKVVSSSAQSLIIDGKSVSLPPGTLCRLSIPSTHRNPKYWPHGPPADPNSPVFGLDNLDNDLEEFKPERWLRFSDEILECEATRGSPAPDSCNGTLCSDTAPNSSFLWTPVKGSYLPFSDGQRSCLGRKFAQVEVMAALAVILRQYSVELAVDELANDDEVAGMNAEQRKSLWGKAYKKAQDKMQNDKTCIITVQLNNTSVPLRFVEKGHERFFDV